jgi:probable HAF family extracellular repeat protein
MAAPAADSTRPDPGPATGTGRPPPGYVLERGQFTPVVVPPGVEDPSALGIGPTDLNDRRQIVGVYSDNTKATSAPDATRGAFLLDRGRYLRLNVPGARKSNAFDINDRGQVVGQYQDANGVFHGYVWQRGRFRTIDVPGQPPGTTNATGINNRGQITGLTGPVQASVGFVLDRGRFTTFKVPGAQVTFPAGINDQGQIVGFSISGPTATGPSGFLRDTRGRFTAINRPGAVGTAAFDINNRGQIAIIAPSPPPTDPSPMGRMA